MIRNFVRILTVLCALGLFAGMTFAQTSGSQSSATKMSKKSSTKKSSKVDINSATKEELVATGMDEATAQKVIDGRPYKTKRALLNKHILTKDEYTKVSGKIIAHRAKKKTAAKM